MASLICEYNNYYKYLLTIIFILKERILILILEDKCLLRYNRLYISCVAFVLSCYVQNNRSVFKRVKTCYFQLSVSENIAIKKRVFNELRFLKLIDSL